MKKNALKLTAVLIVCAVLLWLVQGLLMPKYMTESKEGNLIAEYYEEYGYPSHRHKHLPGRYGRHSFPRQSWLFHPGYGQSS